MELIVRVGLGLVMLLLYAVWLRFVFFCRVGYWSRLYPCERFVVV